MFCSCFSVFEWFCVWVFIIFLKNIIFSFIFFLFLQVWTQSLSQDANNWTSKCKGWSTKLEMAFCLSKITALFLLLYSFLLFYLKVVIVKKYDKTVGVYYCTDYPQFSFLFPEALFSVLRLEGLNLGREHSHWLSLMNV